MVFTEALILNITSERAMAMLLHIIELLLDGHLGGQCFHPAYAFVRVENLPLQIRYLYDVMINNTQRSYMKQVYRSVETSSQP